MHPIGGAVYSNVLQSAPTPAPSCGNECLRAGNRSPIAQARELPCTSGSGKIRRMERGRRRASPSPSGAGRRAACARPPPPRPAATDGRPPPRPRATCRGFIPARTGNTTRTTLARKFGPVHPRVNGEHLSGGSMTAHVIGSSPRTRGTLRHPLLQRGQGRFIPGYTGNTKFSEEFEWPVTVHPRVHGEHSISAHARAPKAGSSPRTRGTRLGARAAVVHRRFIPAYTGNTRCSRTPGRSASVHPRVHGEHVTPAYPAERLTGSSPRTRGTHAPAPPAPPRHRFIPAYTGNTPSSGRSPSACPVHPRVHGEHAGVRQSGHSTTGSSPRTRGTPPRTGRGTAPWRFIPAYTGNTHEVAKSRRIFAVHPRVHGEHGGAGKDALPSSGSSPRTRGTRAVVVKRHLRCKKVRLSCNAV